MTPINKTEERERCRIAVALLYVAANIKTLTRDQLMALDRTVTKEFVRRMIEDKNMEARP